MEEKEIRKEVGKDMEIVKKGIRKEGREKGEKKRVMKKEDELREGERNIIVERKIVGEKDRKEEEIEIMKEMR